MSLQQAEPTLPRAPAGLSGACLAACPDTQPHEGDNADTHLGATGQQMVTQATEAPGHLHAHCSCDLSLMISVIIKA